MLFNREASLVVESRTQTRNVYKRKKRKKKKEQTSKKATILCFLDMSLNGCVSFFCGEWRSLYHSLVTLMILLYIYFTEMASKWQKCEGLKERCMYHSVGLLINHCTFTRYIRWTEKKMRSRKKNLQTTVRRTAIEWSNKNKVSEI